MVENKPGAFGILAIEDMARSRPDGHTLYVGNVSTNAITPVLFQKKFSINYEKDVVSVSRLAIYLLFLVTIRANFDIKSVVELVATRREFRQGALHQRRCRQLPAFRQRGLLRRAGVEMVHIPNKTGAAGMVNYLVVGDAQIAFINSASSAAMIKAGKMRPIVVLAETRLAEYPDVPTLARLGSECRYAALAEHAGARTTPKAMLTSLFNAIVDASKVRQLSEASPSSWSASSPAQSLDEAQSWLKGELAQLAQDHREVSLSSPIDGEAAALMSGLLLSPFTPA